MVFYTSQIARNEWIHGDEPIDFFVFFANFMPHTHIITRVSHYPLVICYITTKKMAIEIVDLPSYKMCGFP